VWAWRGQASTREVGLLGDPGVLGEIRRPWPLHFSRRGFRGAVWLPPRRPKPNPPRQSQPASSGWRGQQQM